MSVEEFTAPGQATRRGAWKTQAMRGVDRIVLAQVRRLLAGTETGRLTLVMPSGGEAVFGTAGDGADVRLVLANYGLIWKSLRRGSIGVGESYMAQDFATNDIKGLLQLFLDNKDVLDRAGRGYFRSRLLDRLYHRLQANSKSGSRRNIARHYDLGNAFYAAWLDRSMTYSSALFDETEPSLEQAQAAKYARIMDALDLSAGHRVLEIGCGWGGFAEMAARSGAHVTGITLSREQLAFAQGRLRAAGLAAQTDIRFEDYRDVSGVYDRIASIEMIEAVGAEHWRAYFQTLANRLKPGGIAAVQAITIAPDMFEFYRRKPDFIQLYIFPGGMLPTEAIMAEQAAAAGLSYEPVETFRHSYARTLRDWRERFLAAWPEISAMGFDERFKRMWEYYLAYCEAGFEAGTIDVGIYRFRKSA